MSGIGWHFPKLNGGQERSYTDGGIETFKGSELIEHLTREICQNSLDARDIDSHKAVIVKFEQREINKSKFPLFEEYSKYIDGCAKFWETSSDRKIHLFLKTAKNILSKDIINILMVSDYNTTGLRGSQSEERRENAWRALVNADGESVKNDEAGGSYGIGKNAPFACSSLSAVFYNTYAKDNAKAFEGVARVASLYDQDGDATQSIGHYRCNSGYKPITAEMECSFRDSFNRTEYGTDIIILGSDPVTENVHWMDIVVQTVLKNFLIAISEKKLVVIVKDIRIDSETLPILIKKYEKCSTDSLHTLQFYETLVNPDDFIVKETIIESEDLWIYIKADKNYKRQIVKFRLTGMLVGQKARNMMQGFMAIVIVRGKKLNELLRLTEPVTHRRWDYKRVEDVEKRKEAKVVIEKIDKVIKSVVDAKFRIKAADTVDSGLGNYIADEVDNLTSKQVGEDKLRPLPKICDDIRERSIPKETVIYRGEKGEGEETDGDIINKRRNNPPGPEPHPKHVELEGETQGVILGDGTKLIITYPKVRFQRIFPVNYNNGEYKLRISPDENCANSFINFYAEGEGNTRDLLEVQKYILNGVERDLNGTKAGPFIFEAGQVYDISLTFKHKEKMLLHLALIEETQK